MARWGIPEGCGRFDGNPRAGCPCGCKRRALGRLQRHGPGPQSASRPGNFQKLQGPERRASGSGPRLSAEALRSRGGRPAAALRFPEASAGRWGARPRRGAGAAQGRRGPLWEGFSAFLSRSGGSAPRIRRETWRPPAGPFSFGARRPWDSGQLAEFSRAARTARPVGHTFGLRAMTCPDRVALSSGEGNGNPLLSCLKNPKDRGAWRATAHLVAKSRTRVKQLSRIQILVQLCDFGHDLPSCTSVFPSVK